MIKLTKKDTTKITLTGLILALVITAGLLIYFQEKKPPKSEAAGVDIAFIKSSQNLLIANLVKIRSSIKKDSAKAFESAKVALSSRQNILKKNNKQQSPFIAENKNLSLAEALSTLSRSGSDKAVQVGKLAIKNRAELAGLNLGNNPITVKKYDSPDQAMTALLSTMNTKISSTNAAKIKNLNKLSIGVRTELTKTVAAFEQYYIAGKNAAPGLDTQNLKPYIEKLISAKTNQNAGNPKEFHKKRLESLQKDSAQFAKFLKTPPTNQELARVLNAYILFLDASSALGKSLAKSPSNIKSGSCAPEINIPPAVSIDTRAVNNCYVKSVDYFLSIDFGGNDDYRNNAGGSTVNTGVAGEHCFSPANQGAAALLDFGAGSDKYKKFRPHVDDYDTVLGCGTIGGGFGGYGFVYEDGGNDYYGYPRWDIAPALGTIGGGFAGIGMLVDLSGNDTYYSYGAGSNGGAMEILVPPSDEIVVRGLAPVRAMGSSGFLIDMAGNDTYTTVGFVGNGGGALNAAGFSYDEQGNDKYVGSCGATNGGGGAAGIGLLFDRSGIDQYTGIDIFFEDGSVPCGLGLNGGAFLSGAGLLVDQNGNDLYEGAFLGVNGGASSLNSVGMLLDVAGNDQYKAWDTDGLNGGGSTFFLLPSQDDGPANGFLIDYAGDDRYSGGYFGANGGGYNSSTGFLFDNAGSDVYSAHSPAGNGGAGRLDVDQAEPEYSTFPGVGLLLDLGSNPDCYKDESGGNGGLNNCPIQGYVNRNYGLDITVLPKENPLGAQIDK